MSFSETVTTKDGTQKTVTADTKENLKEAVKVAKNESAPTYPNINKPVAKGHDKVDVQDDLSVQLKDGTGAHNSPHDAINADGSTEGAWDGSEEPESVEQSGARGNDVVDGRAQENDQPPQAREDSDAKSKTSK